MTDTDNLPDTRSLIERGVDGQRLLSVFNFIAANDERHDQSAWGGLDADKLREAHSNGDLDMELKVLPFEGSVYAIDNKVKDIDCGSTGCFAGWTVLLAGGKPVIQEYQLNKEHQVDFTQVLMPEGGVQEVATVAADLLFGPYTEVRYFAEDLFNGDNSPAFLREFVLRVLNGATYHDLQAWIEDADDYEGDWDYEDHPDYEPITFDEGLGVYV